MSKYMLKLYFEDGSWAALTIKDYPGVDDAIDKWVSIHGKPTKVQLVYDGGGWRSAYFPDENN